jgi:hypothetical protein
LLLIDQPSWIDPGGASAGASAPAPSAVDKLVVDGLDIETVDAQIGDALMWALNWCPRSRFRALVSVPWVWSSCRSGSLALERCIAGAATRTVILMSLGGQK